MFTFVKPTSSSLSAVRPEIQLLFACAHTSLDPYLTEKIRSLLGQPIDWEYVCRLSDDHAVLPLVYGNLAAVNDSNVPPAITASFEDYCARIAMRNLMLTGELLRLTSLFEASDIQSVPYKGPALAALAYGNLALRQFGDIDLFLDLRDVEAAKAILLSHKYQVREGTVPEDVLFREHYHYQFINPTSGIIVELHWAFTLGFWSFPVETRDLWQRLQPLQFGGVTVRSFSPEDLLLILCIHGAKHFWWRLSWICDINALISACSSLDWERTIRNAERGNTLRVLLLGLQLAHVVLGTPLPDAVVERIQADGVAIRLVAHIHQRIASGAIEPIEGFPARLFYLRMRERPADRVRYILFQVQTYVSVLLTPAGRERSVLPSPKFVNLLYPALYPARVIFQCFSRKLGRLYRRS